MRRHPNERLVCQASVLIAEKGSLTMGGLPVRQAIIDTGAHHVLIGKGLANQLKLDVSGRTIERGILLMTAEGGEPKWMPKTRRPVEVVLLPGTEKECCIRLQCGVSESEDYDVLVRMELLYRIGATICTWQEKVLFRVQYWDPESSVGTLLVRFVRQEPREAYQAQRKDLTEELEDWPWERYEEEYERRIERRTLGQGLPDLKEWVNRVQALNVPICILELYGGIGTGLAAVLRAGCMVKKWIHVERDPAVRQMARHYAELLREEYPDQMWEDALPYESESEVHDVRDISERVMESWGQIDLIIAGWECQGYSRAGEGLGMEDARGASFRDLRQVLEMVEQRQGEVAYIMENVDLAEDKREPVKRAFEEIVGVLGRGVPADAAQLGSRAHRPRR
ncbi:unnamed protein product [Closterium sp. NIES-54]